MNMPSAAFGGNQGELQAQGFVDEIQIEDEQESDKHKQYVGQPSQQHSLQYRDEFARRYYPNSQLQDKFNQNAAPPQNAVESNHKKKRSAKKSDFLSRGESFASEHALNQTNQSHVAS